MWCTSEQLVEGVEGCGVLASSWWRGWRGVVWQVQPGVGKCSHCWSIHCHYTLSLGQLLCEVCIVCVRCALLCEVCIMCVRCALLCEVCIVV